MSEEEKAMFEYAKKLLEHIKPRKKERQLKLTDNKKVNKIKIKRKYSQDWPAYNGAKTKERLVIYQLLDELLSAIKFPNHNSVGRKPISLKDKIFFLVIKAYNGNGARKCISDIYLCKKLGYISGSVPHFNTVTNALNDEEVSSLLQFLITFSGAPLAPIEKVFAPDSSGFSTDQYGRWLDVRTASASKKRNFVKCHITCGVKTHIITSVRITAGSSGDSPQFIPMLEDTSKVFKIAKVCADKGYISFDNYKFCQKIESELYTQFKENAVRKFGPRLWRQMFDFFKNKPEEYLRNYHPRSNVETVFHMLKTKLQKIVRGKNLISQKNEVLSLCLTHNLCVLTQEIFELGIIVDFNKCAKSVDEQKWL